jgi:O-antigen ligase
MVFSYPLVILTSAFMAFAILVVMSFKLTIAVAGTAALFAFISQLFFKDRARFWLVVFILALPFVAIKFLGSSEALVALLGRLGVPSGAPPVPRVLLTDLILFILIAIWAFRVFFRGQKIFIPKPAIYFATFILWAFLSFINSVDFSYSGYELLRLIKFILIYLFIANNIKTEKDVKILVICLAIGALLQGIICVVEYKYQISLSITGHSYLTEETPTGTVYYGGTGDEGEILRGSGTVGPHNIQAMYFEILMPLLFGMALFLRKHLAGLFYLIAFISAGTGLYFTFSRGGLGGTLIGCVTLLMISAKKKLTPKPLFVAIMLILLIILAGFSGKIKKMIDTRKGTFQARLEMDKVAVEMIKVHPILGFGLNTSVIHLPDYDPKDVTIGYPVHNHYLIIASELGLVGLALFILFYYKAVQACIYVMQSSRVYLAAAAVGIIAGFSGVAVHMVFDMFGDEVIQTLLLIFAGTAVAMKKITEGNQTPTVERTLAG